MGMKFIEDYYNKYKPFDQLNYLRFRNTRQNDSSRWTDAINATTTTGDTKPDYLPAPTNAYSDPSHTQNSASHQREGQNVLYNDSHVAFERAPNVGIEKDNIYKCWGDLAHNRPAFT